MRAKTLIPDPSVITIEQIVPEETDIVLVARTRRCAVPCPVCEQPATRFHSWYTRHLRDLPWQGLAVSDCRLSPPPSASAPPASRRSS